MKKGFSYVMIPVMIIAVITIVTGYFTFVKPQIFSSNIQVFFSEEECEQKTEKDCSFMTCDNIPEGKTIEEACGKNFKSGWVITPKTIVESTPLMDITMEQSSEIAKQFIIQDETYVFDGVQNSIKFVNYGVMRCPYCWVFAFEFNCKHPGYGNRGGQTLIQNITLHTVQITVSKGKIISAIIDKKWDMLTEKLRE